MAYGGHVGAGTLGTQSLGLTPLMIAYQCVCGEAYLGGNMRLWQEKVTPVRAEKWGMSLGAGVCFQCVPSRAPWFPPLITCGCHIFGNINALF